MNRLQQLGLPIGIILLAITFIMESYLPCIKLLSFIEGFLVGLLIVLSSVVLSSYIKKRKK